jgi:hypothetical protein
MGLKRAEIRLSCLARSLAIVLIPKTLQTPQVLIGDNNPGALEHLQSDERFPAAQAVVGASTACGEPLPCMYVVRTQQEVAASLSHPFIDDQRWRLPLGSLI